MARPTSLDPETVERFCAAIGRGNTIPSACALSGISERTYYNWVARGDAGEEPFMQFLQALKTARAEFEQKQLQLIQSASYDDAKHWTAAAWLLERTNPKRWSLRVRQAVEEELESALDRLRSRLSPETYNQVLAALAEEPGPAALAEGPTIEGARADVQPAGADTPAGEVSE
jgi:hypothetical protein